MKIHTEKKLQSMETVQAYFALFAGVGWFFVAIQPICIMGDYYRIGSDCMQDDLNKLPWLIVCTCVCTVVSLFMSKWRLQYDYDILKGKINRMSKEIDRLREKEMFRFF